MRNNKLSLFRQYYAAATGTISVIILGTALGWPSPILVILSETGKPFYMTDSEVSWMVALLYLGNMLSPIPAGQLMDLWGRKKSLLILSVIPFCAWVLIYFASAAYQLYIARFFQGAWSGIVSTICPMFLAEISEPRIRGALSTFVQLMTNAGVLFEYIIGPIVGYKSLALVTGVSPIIFVIAFSFVPETPYWQVMKGRKDRAGKSLAWLRGHSSQEDRDVLDELEEIAHAVQEEMRNKKTFLKSICSLVETRGNKKALIIVEVLAFIQRMSGISALMAFTSTTLPGNVGPLTPNNCVIIMGSVWVLSVFVATALVDRLGRKPLLLISTVGCGISMFFAGTWFFLQHLEKYYDYNLNINSCSWVPFASFITYGIAFSLGLGPIASTIQSEAFPTNIKGIASGVTSVVLALTSFIMNKLYGPIEKNIGMYLNYWIFSISCFVGTFFVIFYVIETKGKSLHEIQEEFNLSSRNINTMPKENETV